MKSRNQFYPKARDGVFDRQISTDQSTTAAGRLSLQRLVWIIVVHISTRILNKILVVRVQMFPACLGRYNLFSGC
jgi:hypothetical protein